MQNNSNNSYYAARASKERALADKATDAAIRQIHVEMATRYELLSLGESAPSLDRQSTG